PLGPAEAVPNGDGSSRRWIGLGLGGVGVAGVTLGAVFGLAAKSKLDQSNAGFCDATDHCNASGLALRKDATQAAMGSNIGLAIGGAALATGLVLYLTAPGAHRTPNVAVVAAPMLGGGGGALRASF
ncbi:MAG: hypothetical protein M3O36_17635, partial [Myxococcota bacterium]|nr:hypothetical protein [Myxococcota bacterium]